PIWSSCNIGLSWAAGGVRLCWSARPWDTGGRAFSAAPGYRRAQARFAAAPSGRLVAGRAQGGGGVAGGEGFPCQTAVSPLLRAVERRSGADDRHPGLRTGAPDRRADAAAAHRSSVGGV